MKKIYEGNKFNILLTDNNTHIIQILDLVGIHKEVETPTQETLNAITKIVEEFKAKRNRIHKQFKKRLNKLDKQTDDSDLDIELKEITKILQ